MGFLESLRIKRLVKLSLFRLLLAASSLTSASNALAEGTPAAKKSAKIKETENERKENHEENKYENMMKELRRELARETDPGKKLELEEIIKINEINYRNSTEVAKVYNELLTILRRLMTEGYKIEIENEYINKYEQLKKKYEEININYGKQEENNIYKTELGKKKIKDAREMFWGELNKIKALNRKVLAKLERMKNEAFAGRH